MDGFNGCFVGCVIGVIGEDALHIVEVVEEGGLELSLRLDGGRVSWSLPG